MKAELNFLRVSIVDHASEESLPFSIDMCCSVCVTGEGSRRERQNPLSRGNDPSNGAN